MTEPYFNPPDVDLLNERMPSFVFVCRIAADDCKAVYLAKQKSLDRKVAVKIYSPELSRSREFRESFAASTKVMAKLKHPNLIGVYDSGVDEDMLYSVSEFVAGKPLWSSSKGEPVHIKYVQTLIEGICSGMCYAHKHGVFHGALGMKNILIDESRLPKIGGFSQACGDTLKLDASALRFRAPEMAGDGAKPTAQSDIYSVGVILREMAVGQSESIDALAELGDSGPALKKLVLKATSDDPAKRHCSLEEFHEQLLEAFDEGVAKKPTGVNLNTAFVKSKPVAAAGLPKSRGIVGTKLAAAPGKRGSAAHFTKPPKPAAPVKPPSSVKLWVHLIIIILLLWAIRVVWDIRSERKANNHAMENQQSQPDELHALRPGRPRDDRAYQRPLPPDRNDAADDFPHDPDPVIARPRKDPAKELARLKLALKRGSRSEMPDGTVEFGNHLFYYVDIPMTWRDAFWFALEHGGYLAVPDAKARAIWMRERLAPDPDSNFWLGAAKSGPYSWTLADGRPWRPRDPSISLGEYVAVGSEGQLVSQEGQARRDFIIQWSKDGSNPGSLKSLLEITKQSTQGPSPIYPPGTIAFGVRRYFYVPISTDWKQAVLSARSSGGHLAVVGSIAEKFNIDKMTKSVSAEDGIWLGGFHLAGKGWRWTTGERWHSSEWPQDKTAQSSDGALLMSPGGPWLEKPRDGKASGYLIEWSDDHKNAP